MKTNTTFKGAPKPYGATGHFDEPMRHKLQGSGFKTGHLAGGVSAGMPMPAPKGRVVEIRVYKFDELSPKAQEKALNDQRDFESEIWDAKDYIIPNFKEDIEKFGISDIEVAYSGFGSQGDGASFTGLVNLPKFIKSQKAEKEYPNLLKDMEKGEVDDSVRIERYDSQYSHEMTVSSGTIHSKSKKSEKETEKLEDELTKFVRDRSKKLYEEMQVDYDDRMSDESLKDAIEANEYEYKGNGEMFNEAREAK